MTRPARLPRASVADVPEAEFQREVMRLAKKHGWLVSHVYRGRVGKRWITGAAAGFPDLTLIRPPFLILLELKKVGEKPTDEQKRWIARAQRCRPPMLVERPDLLAPGGVYAGVVDTRDWPRVQLMLTRPNDYFAHRDETPSPT